MIRLREEWEGFVRSVGCRLRAFVERRSTGEAEHGVRLDPAVWVVKDACVDDAGKPAVVCEVAPVEPRNRKNAGQAECRMFEIPLPVLMPGGHFLCAVPGVPGAKLPYAPGRVLVTDRRLFESGGAPAVGDDPLDLRFYRLRGLRNLLEAAFDGFLREAWLRTVRFVRKTRKAVSPDDVFASILAGPPKKPAVNLSAPSETGKPFPLDAEAWFSARITRAARIQDETNPLAMLGQAERISRPTAWRLPGGRKTLEPGQVWEYKKLMPRSPFPAERDIHPSFRGSLCPVESPESTFVGLTLQLASGAAAAEDGTLVPALADRPERALGTGVLQVPFLAHNDSPRLMMGAKNLRQALPPIRAAAPSVKSGFEADTARRIVDVLGLEPRRTAPVAGTVTAVEPHRILLAPALADEPVEIPLWQEPASGKPKPFFWNPLVEPGARVAEGDSVALRAGFAASGPAGLELALGADLFVVYLPWEGWNFEDAVVAAESASQNLRTRLAVPLVIGPVRPGDVSTSLRPGIAVRGGAPLLKGQNDWIVPEWIDSAVVASVVERAGQDGRTYLHVVLIADIGLSPGDKLMGRYGNKGVISRILPKAELPHVRFPDGTEQTPDVILNPMGILGRKNPGQLLETHLTLLGRLDPSAAAAFADEATPFARDRRPGREPIFAERLIEALERAGAPRGELELLMPDGMCLKATAGFQYMVRLDHLPAMKCAVRCRPRGNRSALTGQPLLGIAPLGRPRGADGGQRLGEMEMWALFGHGLERTVAEILRVRSRPPVAEKSAAGARGTPQPNSALTTLEAYLRAMNFRFEADGRSGFRLTRCPDPDPETPAEPWGEGWLFPLVRIPAGLDIRHPLTNEPLRVLRELPEVFRPMPKSGRSCAPKRDPLAALYASIRRRLEKLESVGSSHAEADRKAVQYHIECLFGARYSEKLRLPAPLGIVERRGGGNAGKQRPKRSDETKARTLLGLLDRKTGLVRRHLLGRRLDLSGRAVIVPDPTLSPDQVRLPNAAKRAVDAAARDGWKPGWVLLNRNPTLHRYNLLACRIAGWNESPVISLPPLLCGAFGADFDGDTMAWHLPASPEVEAEWRDRASFAGHRRSVASGGGIAHVTQDLVLGFWLLTARPDLLPAEFDGPTALDRLLAPWVRAGGTPAAALAEARAAWLEADGGRADDAVGALHRACLLAFSAATRAGVSASIADLVPLFRAFRESPTGGPDTASSGIEAWLLDALARASGEAGRPLGLQTICLAKARDEKASDLRQIVARAGSIKVLFPVPGGVPDGDEGRGQLEKLERMGLSAATGRAMKAPPPVMGCLLAGLTPDEFFAAARGGRNGMVLKKLATPKAGYFTRLLVEAAFPWRVSSVTSDCGTDRGVAIPAHAAGGRTPIHGNPGFYRSPWFCRLHENGEPFAVCQACMGDDPSTGRPFEPGTPVGILAAQSIGERGTQEAMKKFHKGAGAQDSGDGSKTPDLKGRKAGNSDEGVGTPAGRYSLMEDFRAALQAKKMNLLVECWGTDGKKSAWALDDYRKIRQVHIEMLARTRAKNPGGDLHPLVKAGTMAGLAAGPAGALGFQGLAGTLSKLVTDPPAPAGAGVHPRARLIFDGRDGAGCGGE